MRVAPSRLALAMPSLISAAVIAEMKRRAAFSEIQAPRAGWAARLGADWEMTLVSTM